MTEKLNGMIIGTSGSYQNSGNGIAKALDGNLNDYFDGPMANGCWVGYDLGEQYTVSSAAFAPRIKNTFSGDFGPRLVGGKIQGGNKVDFSDATDLYVVTKSPPAGLTTYTLHPNNYRYVRYLSPNGSYGNISSLEFFGSPIIPVTTSTKGTNLYGCTDTGSSPTAHPLLLQVIKDFSFTKMRLWMEGSLLAPCIAQFDVSNAWHKLGIEVIAVWNFQNMPGARRCSAMSDAEVKAYANSIPPSSETGITYIEFGNEIDFKMTGTGSIQGYFNGTPAQYVQMLSVASPILTEKGYKIIMGNCLYNLNYYTEIAELGGFKYVYAAGRHGYEKTALNCEVDYNAANTFIQNQGVQCIHTEVNLMNPAAATAASELTKLFIAIKTMPGCYLYFPELVESNDGVGNWGLITSKYQINTIPYNALKAAA